ncbi:MAG: tetratricopeptide repeat protein [Gemmatimonadetes bacterium]|nr:tetratricopeptide repeat protein [Gemmatimonadota bacterium]
MKRLAILVGIGAALALGTVKANAQAGLWIPPACKLNTKHFLVNSAQLYLKNATQAKTSDQRATNLRDANRVLNQAVTEGQGENPAIWYFFGRYYVMAEDMPGADSAFRRAEKGAPDCKDDIDTQRRQAWVPEIQAAADALNKNDLETAKVHFRKANAIYQGDPLGLYYLANVFTNQGQVDSGIVYYRRAVEVTEPIISAAAQAAVPQKGAKAAPVAQPDSSVRETYETSVFNLARLYHQTQKWDSAAVWYEKYRQIKPGDMQAVAGLAQVYGQSGDTAKASRLYDDILVKADSVPLLDLFSVGISLFQAGQYDQASRAFQGVLKKSPYYRDALYNLASTYLSMASIKDTTISKADRDAMTKQIGDKMLPVALRMVEIDSYNRNSLRMLAMAYQFTGMQDSILAALTRAEELPFEVNVSSFQEAQNGHQIKGTISAFESPEAKAVADSLKMVTDWLPKLADTLATVAKEVQTGRDPKGKVIPPAIKQALQQQLPVLEKRRASLEQQRETLSARKDALQQTGIRIPPITFEFLNQAGQVVASQTVTEASLTPNQTKDFELTAVGEGITGWRYKASS